MVAQAVCPEWIARPAGRVGQAFCALRPGSVPDEVQQRGLNILTPAQQEAFSEMDRFDHAHALCVFRWLDEAANDDTDLLVAGLLHDIGKVDGTHRVRLFERVANVLLAKGAPALRDRIAGPSPSGDTAGLSLAVHHARIGAERCRRLGCSSETIDLIASYDDPAARSSPALDRLREADCAC
jgi:hypothetical protein